MANMGRARPEAAVKGGKVKGKRWWDRSARDDGAEGDRLIGLDHNAGVVAGGARAASSVDSGERGSFFPGALESEER